MRWAGYEKPSLPKRRAPTVFATGVPVGLTSSLSLSLGCGN